MTRECTFILLNGQKCRCIVARHQDFCRHHHPARPVRQPSDEYSRLARWRDLGRTVDSLPAEYIPDEILQILESLLEDGEGGISDRLAGRLLRSLLRRAGRVPALVPEPADSASPEILAPDPVVPVTDPLIAEVLRLLRSGEIPCVPPAHF